jgi:hypothetical protein
MTHTRLNSREYFLRFVAWQPLDQKANGMFLLHVVDALVWSQTMNSNVTGEKNERMSLKQGFKNQTWLWKPLSIGFTKNQKNWSVFNTKFNFWNLGKRKLKTVVFLKTEWFFDLSVGFLFKIQILNENDKSAGFFWFIAQFFWFLVSQKFEFLNCNQPVFGEPKKPDQFCRFLR